MELPTKVDGIEPSTGAWGLVAITIWLGVPLHSARECIESRRVQRLCGVVLTSNCCAGPLYGNVLVPALAACAGLLGYGWSLLFTVLCIQARCPSPGTPPSLVLAPHILLRRGHRARAPPRAPPTLPFPARHRRHFPHCPALPLRPPSPSSRPTPSPPSPTASAPGSPAPPSRTSPATSSSRIPRRLPPTPPARTSSASSPTPSCRCRSSPSTRAGPSAAPSAAPARPPSPRPSSSGDLASPATRRRQRPHLPVVPDSFATHRLHRRAHTRTHRSLAPAPGGGAGSPCAATSGRGSASRARLPRTSSATSAAAPQSSSFRGASRCAAPALPSLPALPSPQRRQSVRVNPHPPRPPPGAGVPSHRAGRRGDLPQAALRVRRRGDQDRGAARPGVLLRAEPHVRPPQLSPPPQLPHPAATAAAAQALLPLRPA